MEDLTGRRIVVVTGGSSGIGLAAAEALACRGDQVVLVGRDPARLQAAGDRVREASGERPELFRADFAVLDDVRGLAERLRAAYDRIDVLANNAGAIALAPLTTVDGFELSIQANHLAPFLLSNLLRDRIGRMVTTASGAHRNGALDPDDLNAALRRYRPIQAYGTSKQANILFTAEAARRWPDVPAYCFHPGVVRTRFGADSRLVALGMRIMPFRSPEKGAETLVWLAQQDPSRLVNGAYYTDRRLRRPWSKAADPQLAARLWAASAKAVGIDG
ncbi:SDR family NAD(P)-dependent oxidoreductase [Micromonospora sp. KC723]|uniref:SDR family NAD(P)-dependent oxidoreductase n=1 Tax=Micromonospora sp. KC723 TaxID=2530381 RepID=UPI00105359C3|nr:SDR family NAD(P)-dependent oxidoreductase [Micromonospora sp. KC723]TDB77527.1 SDR family NAD(P)-dependent oxidoreductase [Micromonospora sp. KC723]